MLQTTSPQGVADIGCREGIVVAPYRDTRGIFTCGIGHTSAAGAPDPASMSPQMPTDINAAIRSAIAVLRHDLGTYEDRIRRHVTAPMTQTEFDAFVSVDINTGWAWYRTSSGTWTTATAIQRFNAGDKAGAGTAFLNWCQPPEILGRRKQEQALFMTGAYLTSSIAVYGTDGQGNLDRSPMREISRADFMALCAA